MSKIFVAPSENVLATTPNAQGNVAGFWQGLWHGFTTPITFLMSLFNKNVSIYEVHNNGAWYNFGYIIGLSMVFGGGGGGGKLAKGSEVEVQVTDNLNPNN